MKNIMLYKMFGKRNRLNKKHNAFYHFFKNLSLKERVFFMIPILCLVSLYSFGNNVSGTQNNHGEETLTNLMLIDGSHPLAPSFIGWTNIIEIARFCINYIVNIQIESTTIIASTPLGGTGIFDTITQGLTIFAAIACFVKLLQHFLNTERFDNVKAFTGFFSYLSIFLLFAFSKPIVNHVAGLNTSINVNNIKNVGHVINNELGKLIKEDWGELTARYKVLDEKYENAGITEKPSIAIKMKLDEIGFYLSNLIRYMYYSFFSILMTSALAIPTVVMTIMVKVILSIMIMGAKLVFLLAFIPGFENTWKTYMLNLLNVLLWVPIFNVIMSFILSIVVGMMANNAIGTGQVIWLSIITLIMAYQSISLTTTTANTIISGAGASMSGALGSIAAMGATTIVAGTAAVAGSVAVMAASKGASGNEGGSKFSKD